MDPKLSIILVIGVAFLSIGVADAIECYECSVLDGKKCDDPFNSAGVKKCTGNSCTKSLISGSGMTAVTRGCSQTSIQKDTCTDVSTFAGTSKSCGCGSNLCNGGGMLQPTYAVVLGLATAILRTINVI